MNGAVTVNAVLPAPEASARARYRADFQMMVDVGRDLGFAQAQRVIIDRLREAGGMDDAIALVILSVAP